MSPFPAGMDEQQQQMEGHSSSRTTGHSQQEGHKEPLLSLKKALQGRLEKMVELLPAELCDEQQEEQQQGGRPAMAKPQFAHAVMVMPVQQPGEEGSTLIKASLVKQLDPVCVQQTTITTDERSKSFFNPWQQSRLTTENGNEEEDDESGRENAINICQKRGNKFVQRRTTTKTTTTVANGTGTNANGRVTDENGRLSKKLVQATSSPLTALQSNGGTSPLSSVFSSTTEEDEQQHHQLDPLLEAVKVLRRTGEMLDDVLERMSSRDNKNNENNRMFGQQQQRERARVGRTFSPSNAKIYTEQTNLFSNKKPQQQRNDEQKTTSPFAPNPPPPAAVPSEEKWTAKNHDNNINQQQKRREGEEQQNHDGQGQDDGRPRRSAFAGSSGIRFPSEMRKYREENNNSRVAHWPSAV